MVIGVGIDVVRLDRIARLLRRHPDSGPALFTATEHRMADGGMVTLAECFAVREAAAKALGVGWWAIEWHGVALTRAADGGQALAVTGQTARLAAERGVRCWRVATTRIGQVALATVIALG